MNYEFNLLCLSTDRLINRIPIPPKISQHGASPTSVRQRSSKRKRIILHDIVYDLIRIFASDNSLKLRAGRLTTLSNPSLMYGVQTTRTSFFWFRG
jgi:hypothetical protein